MAAVTQLPGSLSSFLSCARYPLQLRYTGNPLLSNKRPLLPGASLLFNGGHTRQHRQTLELRGNLGVPAPLPANQALRP